MPILQKVFSRRRCRLLQASCNLFERLYVMFVKSHHRFKVITVLHYFLKVTSRAFSPLGERNFKLFSTECLVDYEQVQISKCGYGMNGGIQGINFLSLQNELPTVV